MSVPNPIFRPLLMPRYSDQFVAQLLAQHDYGALVELQGIALGWAGFEDDDPAFGWPQPIFAVFEMLTWLAQADRSGVWTYYEVTPIPRQECAIVTLDMLKAAEFRHRYVDGKEHWQNADAIEELDRWIGKNEQPIIEWAFAVLAAHPAELALVCS